MARNFCLLILLVKFALGSEEFIFWASVNTTNFIVSFEQIVFSKAMTLTNKGKIRLLCQIDGTREEGASTLEFLNSRKDEIFYCFAREKVSVKSEFYRRNGSMRNTGVIKVAPVRFTIEFKQNSAIISVFTGKENL